MGKCLLPFVLRKIVSSKRTHAIFIDPKVDSKELLIFETKPLRLQTLKCRVEAQGLKSGGLACPAPPDKEARPPCLEFGKVLWSNEQVAKPLWWPLCTIVTKKLAKDGSSLSSASHRLSTRGLQEAPPFAQKIGIVASGTECSNANIRPLPL